MQPFTSDEIDIVERAISRRRSMGISRLQKDKPVDRALLEQLFEAANWAPSHGETEPWRFTVYTDESRRALGEAFAAAYKAVTPQGEFKDAAYQAQKERAFNSPVWIAIGTSPKLGTDGSLVNDEHEEMIATGCAIQNLHIMASAFGLAGMWQSNAIFTSDSVAQFVGLKPPAKLLGFFILGWPNIDWPEGERAPAMEKVRWADDAAASPA